MPSPSVLAASRYRAAKSKISRTSATLPGYTGRLPGFGRLFSVRRMRSFIIVRSSGHGASTSFRLASCMTIRQWSFAVTSISEEGRVIHMTRPDIPARSASSCSRATIALCPKRRSALGFGNGKLASGVAVGRNGNVFRLFQKHTEHAQRAELDSNAQAIVISTMQGDKCAVYVVEVEIAG